MTTSSTTEIINTGSLNTIPASQIVTLAQGYLGLETNDQAMLLERYVIQGLNQLDTPSLKKERFETVDVTCEGGNPMAKIPCGLYFPIMIVPHCGDYFDQYLYADVLTLKSCGCEGNRNIINYMNTFKFTDNNIVLANSNGWQGVDADGDEQTFSFPDQLDVYFWGANVDSDGFVRIYQQYEVALAAYASWRYATGKARWTKDDKMTWFNEFKRERLTLISSERKAEQELQRRNVKNLLTALVVNPRRRMW